MLRGSCHCGSVTVEVPGDPAYVIDCNCSLCRRTRALWAYYSESAVRVAGQTDEYVWGDRTLATVRCRQCGCVTHWRPLQPNENGRMGVNMANFDPAVVADTRVRRFDGADSWTYFDPE